MKKYDNLYMEIYALLAVRMAYPKFVRDMKKGEHPDWQDCKNDIGLEVTIAQTKHMGYAHNLAKLYLGKDIISIPLKIQEGFLGDFGARKGKLDSISDSKGMVDGTRHVSLATESIKTKLDKLNSKHFSVFGQNLLFIFMPFTTNDEDLELFCVNCRRVEDEYKQRFSYVFLFDNGSLSKIAMCDFSIERYIYIDEQLKQMKNEALCLREGSSWNDGTSLMLNF